MTQTAVSYAGYVIAAYSVATVLIGGLTLWTILAARSARQELSALEAEAARAFPRLQGGGGSGA